MSLRVKNISSQAIVVFILTLALCLTLILAMFFNRTQIERLMMERLVFEKSIQINDTLSRLLLRTQILSSLVMHNDGDTSDFDHWASFLIDDPAILNLLVAPEGIVSHVYPLEGNEALLGLDFFYQEAVTDTTPHESLLLVLDAKETRRLVMGGPFRSIQGWKILVGRQAVFLENADGTETFWGIVGITLKHPQALDGAGLADLTLVGFDYELWRVSPDNERQVIGGSMAHHRRSMRYVDIPITIMNVHWYFRILTAQAWYRFPEAWLALGVSIIIALMAGAIMQNYQEVKNLKNELEKLSITDSLTGAYNRRYFMETTVLQMGRVTRQNSGSYVIIFDLDHFKSVNDTYGHQSGDVALKETALRVTASLRPYDIFARYGGEEFILFISEIDKESALQLAERIRLDIAGNEISVRDSSITITASFGIAPAAPDYKLEDAIALADKALYRAKEEGRNRVVFMEFTAATNTKSQLHYC